jgi:hypothetical protein
VNGTTEVLNRGWKLAALQFDPAEPITALREVIGVGQ